MIYISDVFCIYKSDIEDSKIIGFLEAFVLEENQLNGYMRTLYVDPEHQRKGVGSLMLSYVKNTFKEVKSFTLETSIYNNKVIPIIKLQLNFR